MYYSLAYQIQWAISLTPSGAHHITQLTTLEFNKYSILGLLWKSNKRAERKTFLKCHLSIVTFFFWHSLSWEKMKKKLGCILFLWWLPKSFHIACCSLQILCTRQSRFLHLFLLLIAIIRLDTFPSTSALFCLTVFPYLHFKYNQRESSLYLSALL